MAKDPYDGKDIPNSMDFPGRGVAGNVLGAIGGFFKGNNNQSFVRNRPPMPGMGRGYNDTTWNQPAATGMVTPTRTATAPAAVRTPQRKGNTAREPNGATANNGAKARTGWGLLGGGGWFGGGGASTPSSPGMAHVGNPPRKLRTPAPTMGAAPGAVQQAAVDRSISGPRSAEATAADPHNWAGIARDLGNAGSPGFAKYKTGGYASSAAQTYVKAANLATAPFEGPPGAVATAKPRAAVQPLATARAVTNPRGWSRSEGGPRARAARNMAVAEGPPGAVSTPPKARPRLTPLRGPR
jgi:hypothetical protein